MALAKIKKIQLIAVSQHKEKILEILQNSEATNIISIEEQESTKELQKTNLIYANLQFAINLLSKYGKKRGFLAGPIIKTAEEVKEKAKEFNYQVVVDKCLETEENLIKAKNTLSAAENELALYSPWKNLNIELQNLGGTKNAKIICGSVKSNLFGPAIEEIHKLSNLISSEIVKRSSVDTYFYVIFSQELEKEIRQALVEHKFSEADFPLVHGLIEEYCEELETRTDKSKSQIKILEKDLKELSQNLDDLKIVYDYFGWQKEKMEAGQKSENTQYSFVMKAWIPKENIQKLEEELEKETKEYQIMELELEKDEIPPVIIKNRNFLSPFEAVSRIYGLPKSSELDPTPFLAIFFILFFALCLTDAGYGILMFVVMALILKYFKLGEGIKKLVKLLMYGGVMTFIIGAIFGGWFGLTPDQVPEFLTYTAAGGERMFIFQKINALNSPITVLILALSLGFIQILLGVTMKFVHGFMYQNKKDALLDTGPWIITLTGIGFFILTMTGVLPASLAIVGKIWLGIAGILLIATQGREKKNIIMKILSGVLSLYGLVGYMSDVLSYSRILALGLATAIIGLAVNIVADLVGGLPYIGWVLMVVVFIGGHIFNLLINALGSFIHSGRLQFVEFFTKFMEGGGDEFQAFSRKSKYVYLKK